MDASDEYQPLLRAVRKKGKIYVIWAVGLFIFLMSGGTVWSWYIYLPKPQMNPAPLVQVAVVGGGPAGVATLWALSQEAKKESRNIQLTLFEAKERVGGRMQLDINYGDSPLREKFQIEDLAAGSLWNENIFATRAREIFDVKGCEATKKTEEVGYWTGQGFVSIVTRPLHELSIARWLSLTTHYGWWWFRNANRLKGSNQLTRYFAQKPTVATVGQLLERSGIAGAVRSDSHEQIIKAGVGKEYLAEVLIPQIRRQLGGQIPRELSAYAVNQVTWLQDQPPCNEVGKFEDVLEMFLTKSDAKIHLNTQVTGIERLVSLDGRPAWIVTSEGTHDDLRRDKQAFDHLILTGPWNTTTIPDSHEQDPIFYRPTWVTYLISSTKLQAPYFGAKDPLPDQILPIPDSSLPEPFFGIYELAHVKDVYGFSSNLDAVHYMYRVLSSYPISNLTLFESLQTNEERQVEIRESMIENAYPILYPRNVEHGSFKVQDGLWHTGSIEIIGSDVGLSWGAGENVGRLVYSEIKIAKSFLSQQEWRSSDLITASGQD